MTCPFSRQDGAYLLGALSPQERRTYEEHLANCPICSAALSEVAGLPGLLARLPAEAVEADPPPADLLPTLLRAVESERRRSRRRVQVGAALAAAAAFVAVALVGTAIVTADDPRPTTTTAAPVPPSPIAMTRVADIPVRATAALVDKPWGTEIDLRCTYTEAVDGAYNLVLWAVARSGKSEQIAVWEVISNREARVTGSTSLHSADLAVLEVRTTKGKPVLRLKR